MTPLSSTLVLYVLVGAGVALAVFLTLESVPGRRWNALLAIPFWPLYVPLLLTRGNSAAGARRLPLPPDEMTAAILQVDRELAGALASLDGWADGLRVRAGEKLGELRSAWLAQAERIREMDRLLKAAESAPLAPPPDGTEPAECVRRGAARRQNLDKLRDVRRRTYDNLMGTLAWIRELVSMIHLAKFTGAPASRAEELLDQIAAAGLGDQATRSHGEACGIKASPDRRPASSSAMDSISPKTHGIHG
jgi:hypothetical protein